MATTNIELDVENITGVADANDQFIISAQKFIVSSIPKDLLTFAQKASSASTDGSAISFSVNDSIIDIQRNGYSCREIPMSEAIWALDSSSLKYATAKYPVWYHKQGAVHFAPVTNGSNAGYIFYIDYSLIDDNSDLRNAVIYRASAMEFSKLASDLISSWTSPSLPVAPASPSFGSDLTISSTAPTKPIIIKSSVDTSGWTAPAYTKPTIVLSPAPSISNLSITSVTPVPPSAPSFSTPAISTITTSSTTVSNIGTPPVYTAPTVASDSAGVELTALTQLDSQNTIDDFDGNAIEFDQWFTTAAHLIEDEEDIELANAQLQKISTYLQAYQAQMQNQLNVFNDANAEYQAKLQEAIQQAQINAQKAQQDAQLEANEKQQEANLLLQKENQEYAASLQKFNMEVQKYQANVSAEVQEYQQNLAGDLQVWQAERTTDLQKYNGDIQNEQAEFNKELEIYKAQIQASIQDAQLDSAEDAQNIQKYSAELQEYQNEINKEIQDFANTLSKNTQEYQNKIAKYGAELQSYQAEVAEQTSEKNSIQQNIAYYNQQVEKYYNWSQAEVTQYVQNNSKMINKTMAAQAAQRRG